MTRNVPAWFIKAREIAAKVASPVGKPFAAAKKGPACEVHLYDEIGVDPWSGAGISAQSVVDALKDANGADLEIHVNSPGGQVFEGIAIYNAIRSYAGKKTVFVDGLAASIASVIALAGDKVVTNEGSMWMIHDPMGACFSMGTADEIEDDARKTCAALRKVRDNLLDVYASATGRKVSEISAWMGSETWMTAAEALERGFTDEIAKSDPEPDPKDPEERDEPEGRSNISPRVRADLARAQARAISENFATASRGATGQPVSTQHPGTAGRK